jgi:hypothetical protein
MGVELRKEHHTEENEYTTAGSRSSMERVAVIDAAK